MSERFHYKKNMGQHFIFDPAVIEALADASGVGKEDGVLEIGPGRGTLTVALARRCRKLIAVELDRTLIADLESTLALYPSAEVVQGDILRADLPALFARLGTPCRVATNLPYNITTQFLERFLPARLPFEAMAVMVQKEVGARMTAGPGEEGYGPLSILVAYFAEAEEALSVPASCFTPRPKVDSSFMRLTMRKAPPAEIADEAAFFRLVYTAFATRRKTILNNIVAGYSISRERAEEALVSSGVNPTFRAERLSLADFAALTSNLQG